MKKHEELVVITKTYDLILWSCNHTSPYGKKTQPTCFASILRGRSKAGMPRTEPRSTLQALPSQHNRNPNPTNRRSPT